MSSNDKFVADSTETSFSISRRDSLKWLSLLLAGGALGAYPRRAVAAADTGENPGHWPTLDVAPVRAAGYGQDPDLMSLTAGPWPRTLPAAELAKVNVLADILVPREGDVPSAGELHVADVVDEWISAPYDTQQRDCAPILSLLRWLDDESLSRFDRSFADLDDAQRIEIVDDIAWLDAEPEFQRAAHAFDRLRSIVVAAFFCTPEGSADLGYVGNKVIAGDYPGPTDDALAHFRQVLKSLDLEECVDPALCASAST
jgi:hypothetical protein